MTPTDDDITDSTDTDSTDTDDTDHDECTHDLVPFAQAFDVTNPKVHAGILYCLKCESEVVPNGPVPARTL